MLCVWGGERRAWIVDAAGPAHICRLATSCYIPQTRASFVRTLATATAAAGWFINHNMSFVFITGFSGIGGMFHRRWCCFAFANLRPPLTNIARHTHTTQPCILEASFCWWSWRTDKQVSVLASHRSRGVRFLLWALHAIFSIFLILPLIVILV